MSESNKTLQFLAQVRPTGVVAELLFSPEKGEQVFLDKLFISNVSAQDREYYIFISHGGVLWDATTAIAWDVIVPKQSFLEIDLAAILRSSDGSIAVQSDKVDSINFTLFGRR